MQARGAALAMEAEKTALVKKEHLAECNGQGDCSVEGAGRIADIWGRRRDVEKEQALSRLSHLGSQRGKHPALQLLVCKLHLDSSQSHNRGFQSFHVHALSASCQ